MNFNQQLFSSYKEKQAKKIVNVWLENFLELKAFLQDQTIEDIAVGTKLYVWCVQQRSKLEKGNLPSSAVADLQEIGFIWDLKMHHFDQDLLLLKAYQQEKGRLPKIDLKNNTSHASKLGYFIQKIRSHHKKGQLNKYQADHLSEVPGFVFEVGNSSWLSRAKILKNKLNEAHEGSLRSILRNDSEYSWVIRNKEIFEQHPEILDQEKYEFLAGMNLERFSAPSWDESWSNAFECFRIYGKVTKTVDKIAYAWLIAQRNAFRKKALSDEQIEKIESLSFDLHALGKEFDKETWLRYYKLYQNYIAAHGRVPGPISSPQIYHWVQNNRQVKAGTAAGRKPLEVWKVELLEKIDFDFSQKEIFKRVWNENFKLLTDYLSKHGYRKMASSPDREVKGIYTWVNNQLRKFRIDKLSPACILKFQSIGLNFEKDKLRAIFSGFHNLVHYHKEDYIHKLKALELTDKASKSSKRMEHYLQKCILNGKHKRGTCAICGDEFPMSLLVVAHIKRRSACNHHERCDPAVVMLACIMGCDALFERGYISVLNGHLIKGNNVSDSERVDTHLEFILGKTCLAYSDTSKQYFQYHYQQNQLL